jgi:coatomer subunit beta'
VLLASASGNARMMQTIADTSREKGQNNISFLSYFTLGKLSECLELLIETGRLPEAALFARTYQPSQVSRVVALWREELRKKNEKAAQSLADPKDYENLFSGFQHTLRAEQLLTAERANPLPASEYPNIQVLLSYSFQVNFSLVKKKIILLNFNSNFKAELCA